MTQRFYVALLCLFGSVTSLVAQEYRTPVSGGSIIIKGVNQVAITGHNGPQLVVIAIGQDGHIDERARGLRLLSARGLADNTGLGLTINHQGDKVTLAPLVSNNKMTYQLQVPNSTAIYYEHDTHLAERLRVTDFGGELEVVSQYSGVTLKNTTGPLAINTIYGDILVEYDSAPRHDVSLYSVYGNVDVRLPDHSQVSFRLQPSYGEWLSDLKLEGQTREVAVKGSALRTLRNSDQYQLNGGGPLFTLKATYENIYLRKR